MCFCYVNVENCLSMVSLWTVRGVKCPNLWAMLSILLISLTGTVKSNLPTASTFWGMHSLTTRKHFVQWGNTPLVYDRWWTASHVTRNGRSMPVSSQLIKQAAEDVHKLRSVLRFILGNLHGVSQTQLDGVQVGNLNLTDKYALHLLADFVCNVRKRFSLTYFY